MIILAHLSDIHIDLGQRAEERATRVLRYLEDLPGEVDAVLATGDLADHGLAAEYEQVAKILDSRHRVLHCPGNHDKRPAYREVLLGETPSDAPINQAHEVAGATFLMCDSSIPGRDDGFLADETIDWMDRTLGQDTEAPAFICFHHPPTILHSPTVDGIRQHGEDRLAKLMRRHSRVVAVLCGHAHTAAATTFAGRPMLVAPGVVSTLLLPWESASLLSLEQPPAIAFHILDDELRLTTHYRVVS
jgi:3',5'-cyclic-AMP phosphodiesterase